MTIKNCPSCGGDHFGQYECPFLKEPEDLESSDDDESFIPLLVESEPEWEPEGEEEE